MRDSDKIMMVTVEFRTPKEKEKEKDMHGYGYGYGVWVWDVRLCPLCISKQVEIEKRNQGSSALLPYK